MFTKYFQKGFILTHKNLDLLLIGIFLASFSTFSHLVPQSLMSPILSILDFIILFFIFGYSVSVPKLLEIRQTLKKDYDTIFKILLKNTKRMILPTILFMVLFFIGIIIFALWATTQVNPAGNSAQYGKFIQFSLQQIFRWNPAGFLFSLILSLFAFSSFFFSLENHNFFRSLIDSLKYAFKHFKFILVLMLLSAILYSLSTLVYSFTINNWLVLLISIIGQYAWFVITGGMLYFYQDKDHNK